MVEELGFNPTKLFVVSDVGPKKLSLASNFLNILIFAHEPSKAELLTMLHTVANHYGKAFQGQTL
jgi:hypothetical protein